MAKKNTALLDVMGIDTSRWQTKKRMPWKIAPPGVSFIFVKASQDNWQDSHFTHHWEGGRRHGLLRGAYHYLKTKREVQPQIDALCRAIDADPGELPAVCDQETARKVSPQQARDVTMDFLEGVERRTGRTPILYSYKSHIDHLAKGASAAEMAEFRRFPFWYARYPLRYDRPGAKKRPQKLGLLRVPKMLPFVDIWQVTSKNPLWAGLREWYHHDLDVNLCSSETLARLTSSTPPAPLLDVERAWDYNRREVTDHPTRAYITAHVQADPWGSPAEIVRSIAAAQAEAGLEADGMVGPKTRAKWGL